MSPISFVCYNMSHTWMVFRSRPHLHNIFKYTPNPNCHSWYLFTSPDWFNYLIKTPDSVTESGTSLSRVNSDKIWPWLDKLFRYVLHTWRAAKGTCHMITVGMVKVSIGSISLPGQGWVLALFNKVKYYESNSKNILLGWSVWWMRESKSCGFEMFFYISYKQSPI